ncbi:hypothetical protein L227DRAFT_521441 [Lentinus tigrinus ALCF2SS1-6]|uniref:Ribonucleases P/MRP subunit Pop8-like domain-containing protein n=1 Tax=Lentinus tigrinus ALCF2SS1-6 TaxID=1328759 RepID=A0A5C2SIE2_9APHY|nr:hypothetical protein L227DRAFT_521441 [Lentinus tigrinus ALCF2SS1-6]
MPRRLTSNYHYIRCSVSPVCTDVLAIRKSIQDALGQSFGLVSSHTYVDLLWLAEDGSEVVVRIGPSDAPKLLAAMTAWTGSPRLSLVKESSFLPSLLSVETPS